MLPDTPTHVLKLVSEALDAFEDADLSASARRALRIAKLRGDEQIALRLSLELDLHPPLPRDDVPLWEIQVRQEFVRDRTARVTSDPGSADVEFLDPLDALNVSVAAYEDQLSLRTRMERDNKRVIATRMRAKARNLMFTYLIPCETELRLAVTAEQVYHQHRATVDALLAQAAPDVLDKLTSAVRRSAEQDDAEARAQAVTTCRRVLTAVADIVFPAREETYIDGAGVEREVGVGNYRNRILAGVEQSAGRTTHSKALVASIGELAARLDRLDDLANKGVHDEVDADAMRFAVVQTYMLAGEVITAAGTTGDGAATVNLSTE